MKQLIGLLAIIIGLFLSTAPATSAAFDNDTGFSYMLPADQSPDMAYMETSALTIHQYDQIASPLKISLAEPVVIYTAGEMVINEVNSREFPAKRNEVNLRQFQTTNSNLLCHLHDQVARAELRKLTESPGGVDEGTGDGRLNIGELK